MRRKLLCVAIANISGIAAAYMSDNRLLLTVPLCLLFFCRGKKIETGLILFFIFGCIHMWATDAFIENETEKFRDETNSTVTAQVIEAERGDGESFKITCETEGNKLLCSYYHDIDSFWELIGSDITFTAQIQVPKHAGNPKTFDYNLYLRTEEIYHTATIDAFTVAHDEKNLWEMLKSFIIEKREKFLLSMGEDGDAVSLLRGVLFGDTGALDDEIYKDFQRNGTAHVLAVSGLHIGLLYSLYRRIRRRNKSLLITILFVAVLLIYATATLWSVSVVRAVALILIMITGDLIGRRYDMVTALGAVSLGVCTFNPYAVMGAGFQMSFLAVLSMAFFAPVLKRIGIKGSLSSIVAAQLGLAPYIIYTFNFFAPVGVLCNFPVVWIISILVPLGLIGFMAFLLPGIIFQPINGGLTALSELTVWINKIMAADGKFSVDMLSPPIWAMILLYALLFFLSSEFFMIYMRRRNRKKVLPWILVIAVAAGFTAYSSRNIFDRAALVFVDVGQGDSLHIKADSGKDLLIDGGGNINYNVGEKTLKPYLLKNGVKDIDVAAATHLHTDHFLGIQQLTECFDVAEVLTKGSAGDVIKISADRKLEILWPEKRDPDTDDENLNSLIFKVYYDGVTALITGDITEEGERLLIKKYRGTDKLRADILKAAHHGSKYSTCDEFLQAVNPSLAVISVGKNNYGHPSNDIIEKLQKKGIMVFRTDKNGAVGIICDKGEFSVCTNNP